MRGWLLASRRAAAAAAIVGALAGCSNFLDSAAKNPNAPTSSTASQLLTGIELNQYSLAENIHIETLLMWSQQLYGSAMEWETYGTYAITPSLFNFAWDDYYGGGGLHDARTLEGIDRAASDNVSLGVAQIWEVIIMGAVADIYGDAPYNDVLAGNPQPAFDNQIQIYAHLQALLDTAIGNLASGTGAGPGTADYAFGGAAAPWIAVAHTLKARYYMHVAEVDPTGYASALAQVDSGVATPTAPYLYTPTTFGTDLVAVHTTASQQQNNWWQFAHLGGFGPYLDSDTSFLAYAPNAAGVGIIAATDPRAAVYFPASTGGPGGGVTSFNDDPSSPQPLVTYVENELIGAEAAFETGNLPLAATYLNNELTASLLPAPYTAGTVTLDSIMLEKDRALYLQMEEWNDWKRTCIPAISPVNATFTGAGGAYVPRRIYYNTVESTANSTNYGPVALFDVTATFRNRNDPGDPAGCPTTVSTATTPP